jgi:hypothetical protein
VSSFNVRVFAIRRRPGRKFEVRWRVAGRDRSRSFMTRALADSYRAELVRAARKGLAFAPGTGEPESWAAPEPEPVTWYQHAVAYAEMKWPHLAPHSRASLADALAWVQRASLPVSQLTDPRVIRAALDGLCTRLDGSPAAANTITRKRAVFHGALGYAVELGLLPANPIDLVRWRAPRAAVALSPATVASPAQVRAILAQVARARPELAAFFGCLYYAALRPEEAVPLRRANLILPARGRGKIVLTAACPRTGSAWTSTGTSHEPTGLKHRPDGAIRVVPSRPSWSPCSVTTSATMAPRRTGGCSTAPAAACSANRSTAASGTPPAGRPRPGPGRHCARPPPLRSAARRPVAVAERHRRTRGGRRAGREQRPCPA